MPCVQRCTQRGHDLVSSGVSSHTLLQDFKPLTCQPLKDYIHVCFFSWLIPYMKNADFPTELRSVQYACKSEHMVQKNTRMLFDWHHVLIVSSTL